MIRHNLTPYLLCLPILLACTSARQSIDPAIDETIENILDSAFIPGISISFLENGKIIHSGSYGIKKTSSEEKVDRHTCFEAASLTKPLTAYCAMKLVETGKFALDTPLYRYLEYDPIKYDERYKLITARMVMCHRTGFPNWRRFNDDNKLDIKFTPGTSYGYSGEGFEYLQKVMEKILEKDLGQIVGEWVFKPLGMDHSSMVFAGAGNFATGHSSTGKPRRKSRTSELSGAGTLHTTAEDYSKFLLELVDPKYLADSLAGMMAVPHSALPTADSTVTFGLGTALFEYEGNAHLWHWGDNEVFKAFYMVSTGTGQGVVYFTNSENGLSIVNRLIGISPGINGPFWEDQYTDPGFRKKIIKQD